ncbi:transposase [Gemmata sp.]|uniref:transposase n=1 Tax=Gemmata sp. TaxID=1914242 RepID=UPI003F70E53E
MDRFWLITWTTYGTWLPGDARGFVTDLRDEFGDKYRLNQPSTECASDLPGLRRFSEDNLKGPPIWLSPEQATAVPPQFSETAAYRGWRLLACAVMANHVHLVVGVPGDPQPSKLLQSFKGYASRPLTAGWGRPPSGTWWSEGGSTRKLPDHKAVFAAVRYVRDQERPLVVRLNAEPLQEYLGPEWTELLLASGGRESPGVTAE